MGEFLVIFFLRRRSECGFYSLKWSGNGGLFRYGG